MADKKPETVLKEHLQPVQDALTTAGFQLRIARNKAESLALTMPDTPNDLAELLGDEVKALGNVITRVDAISAHLRKLGEAK